MFYSGLRPSKRPSAEVRPVRKEEHLQINHPSPSDTKSVDVFAFMERGDEPWGGGQNNRVEVHDPSDQEDDSPTIVAARQIEPSQISPRYSDLEVRAIQDGIHRAWGRTSLHSDSGVSVHSGSPDQESPIMQHKYPIIQEDAPDRVEATMAGDMPQIAEMRDQNHLPVKNGAIENPQWDSQDTTYNDLSKAHRPSPQPTQHRGPVRRSQMPEMPSRSSQAVVRRSSRPHEPVRPSKAGYDLLASNIQSRDDAVLKPIYRKFETLNNRMLLYLQDEISEIEDQLHELDAAIAQEDAELGRRPESRRSEAKLPSQLQWHRFDLLGRSFAKVEQYSKLSN